MSYRISFPYSDPPAESKDRMSSIELIELTEINQARSQNSLANSCVKPPDCEANPFRLENTDFFMSASTNLGPGMLTGPIITGTIPSQKCSSKGNCALQRLCSCERRENIDVDSLQKCMLVGDLVPVPTQTANPSSEHNPKAPTNKLPLPVGAQQKISAAQIFPTINHRNMEEWMDESALWGSDADAKIIAWLEEMQVRGEEGGLDISVNMGNIGL